MILSKTRRSLLRRAQKKMKESLKRVTKRNLIQKKIETSDSSPLLRAESAVLVNKETGPNLLPRQESCRPSKLNN